MDAINKFVTELQPWIVVWLLAAILIKLKGIDKRVSMLVKKAYGLPFRDEGE